ncbi:STAS/SEC14 domain-containing protein (plasmid) [Burkholderia thailandensis]|uniref:STAS/SEC14 domain-containing protein n=1 Tax=Burkholderia thailandensis TaxID=57975 RepID=UPI00192DA8AA|nr:STAS/SEC14 domain-containing protein [Burkholderia thailandensis]MBS2132192.1 STAS/SEC14 domain-containing protein [Burkholderia thailandensis]QRA15288.1 STAS/SEC14 domain-containing protein [Burkholderia thailandensis]
MIDIVNDLPDGVAGFVAKGRVTRKDYEDVLIPAMETALKANRKVRCYYELGPEFSGMDPAAAWEDFKLGIQHLSQWERVAVVTDVEWIRIALSVFRFLIPGEVRVFGAGQSAQARQWIIEGKTLTDAPSGPA